MRVALSLCRATVLMVCLSGCAVGLEHIDIAYQTQAAAAPVPGASANPVQLRVTTDNLPKPERVGSKKNGYGMELGGLAATRPIADIVRDGMVQELTQRGFPIGASGTTLDVDVVKFANDFKPGFFVADSAAEVMLAITVRPSAGQFAFARTVTGRGKTENNLVMIPAEARKALVSALGDAVARLFADPSFIRTLLHEPLPPA